MDRCCRRSAANGGGRFDVGKKEYSCAFNTSGHLIANFINGARFVYRVEIVVATCSTASKSVGKTFPQSAPPRQ
jgi:hypothetical protein